MVKIISYWRVFSFTNLGGLDPIIQMHLKWCLGLGEGIHLQYENKRQESSTYKDFDTQDFFGNPSVSLSLILNKIEKVEHHIRMKTHKPIALRFWVEGGVNLLCEVGSDSDGSHYQKSS